MRCGVGQNACVFRKNVLHLRYTQKKTYHDENKSR